MINEKRYNIKAAKFKEEHYIQIEVASMLKSSKHKEVAREFLKFLLSDEFAKIIPPTNWAYPIRDIALKKEFDSLIRVKKPLLIDAKDKKAYIDEWLEALKNK
jgi:thiamine transport system substrate-binding protein